MNNEKKILNYNAVWSISSALLFAFLIPFAVFLRLTDFQIGILAAMPYVSFVISDLMAMFLSSKISSRKNFIMLMLVLKRVFVLPLLILPFVSNAPIYFIIAVFLAYFAGEMVTPTFISLLSDVVPEKSRGKFFAKQNVYVAIFTTIPYIIAGFFLDTFSKSSPYGFIILFAIGIAVGFFSLIYIGSIKEPEYRPEKYSFRNIFEFSGEYGKFALFSFLFNFAYMIASPFFAVYILKSIGLNYTYFVLATSIATACRILFSKPIGRISDRYGDKPVAIVSTFATALVPLAYLLFVTPDNAWLIIPAEMIAGIAWAGFDISNANLLLDFTTKENRIMQIAKFNGLTSIPMVIAPILGGYLAQNASFIWAGIPLVFAVSAVARIVIAPLLFSMKEVRAKKEYPLKVILRAYYHMPMRTLRMAEKGIISYANHNHSKTS